jgi:hypothetical protein
VRHFLRAIEAHIEAELDTHVQSQGGPP